MTFFTATVWRMMVSTVEDVPKDDYLSRIWSICTTLTEEALALASAKASELGFDETRGLVPLPESFINLSSARVTIEDAIEKQQLIQLPITVQKELLANLETISKALHSLTVGVDEVVNLSTSIEVLNTSIWKYGLHNLSEQVLGYQKKLNQIKIQEVRVSKLVAELKAARSAADRANTAATETANTKSQADVLLEQMKQGVLSSASLLGQIKDSDTKAGALFATIQQHEKQSGELAAGSKTAANDLLALDTSIRKFYGEVDEYRRKITQSSDEASTLITSTEAGFKKLYEEATAKVDGIVESVEKAAKTTTEELTVVLETKFAEQDNALSTLTSTSKTNITTFQNGVEEKLALALEQVNTSASSVLSVAEAKVKELEEQLTTRSDETIGANQKKTAEIILELGSLKDQIREQIQQATGFQLFGAFQSRQNEIAKSKNVWVYAIGALVAISAGVTIWIAHEAQFYSVNNFAFWVKLSLTVPLAFAITFCTVQYGRERRLEEEYAFKSSISVSLNPYRDLVLSILEKDGKIDQSKYTEFVINSVTNVFTPPTDKVFDSEKKSAFTEKTFKQTAEIIGTAVKAAK
jgi:hypothetical protein